MTKKKRKKAIPYTEDEKKMILNTPDSELKDLAVLLGRSYDGLRKLKWRHANKERHCEMSVKYKNELQAKTTGTARFNNTRWTKMEEKILMNSKKGDVTLAKELGRTLRSIETKRRRLRGGK